MKWTVGKSTKPDGGSLELEASGLVWDKFRRMGLPLPRRPKDRDGKDLNPQLPTDLTALNDAQLGKVYGEFCVMAQYAQTRLAVHSVTKSVQEAARRYAAAETRLRKEGTVADKASQAEVDPRVRARAVAVLVGESVETLTQAVLEGYLIGRDALSREMTRRSWAFERKNDK